MVGIVVFGIGLLCIAVGYFVIPFVVVRVGKDKEYTSEILIDLAVKGLFSIALSMRLVSVGIFIMVAGVLIALVQVLLHLG